MCLIAYNKPPKVATDNIPIFKHLIYSGFSNRWYTPFTFTPVYPNRILIGKFESSFSEEYYKENITKNDKIIPIYDGFIHAFTTAFAYHRLGGLYIRQQTLIRGYIPKGTKYYISVSGYEICAKEVILTFD